MRKKLLLTLITLALSATISATTHSAYDLRVDGVSKAMGVNASQPKFSWKMDSDEKNATQTAWQIEVTDCGTVTTTSSSNSTSEKKPTLMWDSGKTAGNETLFLPYQGRQLDEGTAYRWRVRLWNKRGEVSSWSEWQEFTTAIDTKWDGAQWIAMEESGRTIVPGYHLNAEAQRHLGNEKTGMYRMPLFRKTATLRKDVRRAVVAVSGMGQFEMFINGKKVGHNFLDPGWTAYDKEILYVMEDVTELLHKGRNVLAVVLGNGFFNIPRERYFKLLTSYGAPRLRLKLMIDYEDGTHSEVVSDRSWRTTASPITYSSIYGGEDYDATLLQRGWDSDADFDDKAWKKPVAVECSTPMKAQTAGRVAIQQRLGTVRQYKNSRGRWVYDFGQNMSGIVSLHIEGGRGSSVSLTPSELLNADSTANQRATGSPYLFRYTLAGGGTEHWQPQFTYYGFRYVEVEGAVPEGEANPNGMPVIKQLDALHTTTDCQPVGRFTCSKPLFNRIYELIDWASRSNMASLTTDCPTREKLGWQEQNNLMQHSLQYCYDLQTLYSKIVNDMAQAQHENGAIPTICPEYTRFADGFEDSPEWGASFIICPWNLYRWYGDKAVIERNYPKMKQYMDYLTGKADRLILSYGLGDWFDIGPKPPGRSQLTSLGVTSTAYMQYEASLMAKMASLIGQEEDAHRYASLAEDIRKAFVEKYFHPSDSTFDRNSQTTNAIVAYMGLAADEAMRQKAVSNLVSDIRHRGNSLTAGDVGYRYVIKALEDSGNSEVIYDMNSRYDVFGYGWQLANGATALTESWQALPNVSNNHLMLGHLMEWFYGGLGGIRQSSNSVAWSEIEISPCPVGDITEADTEFVSPRGTIRCHWRLSPNGNCMRIEIPANTIAHVTLPLTHDKKTLGSGSYTFYY